MLARQQALNTQFQQVIDAFLLALALFAAHALTCSWQISGRNHVRDFRDRVKLDLEYIDLWSLGLDFQILLRTIPAVLSGPGAKQAG